MPADISTVAKFVELIETGSFKTDDIWIHQRRVKTISDHWDYRYAVHVDFDPRPDERTIGKYGDLAAIAQAWEGPRINAVQLRDYLEELQAND